MNKYLPPILSGTVLVCTVTAAVAQTQPAQLEEITVTARKMKESLQDVPVAVAAISQSQLQNNAVADLNQIGELVPQVMIGRAVTGTGGVITIRGISSASVDPGLDQSVSLNIDGVSLSRGRILEAAQFDMQQVEVLEGPQALFFGKNSPAGVISITSADPTDKLHAYVKGGYEFTAKEKYFETALSGPLTDNFLARLSLRGSWMDGWIKNVAQAEPNPFQPAAPMPGALQGNSEPMGHELSGRLTLQWEPADDFSAKFKLTMNQERLNSNAAFNEEFCGGGQAVPTILGRPETNGSDCSANRVVAQSSYPALFAINFPYANGGLPYLRSDVALASLTMDKRFEGVTVTSTTGYYDQAHKGTFNGDRSEWVQIYDAEAERYRMVNEELRANTSFSGSFNAMVGAYFEHSDRRYLNAPSVLNVFDPVAQNYVTIITQAINNSDSYSAFGQLRWKIIPSLELAGGARYTHDVKNAAEFNSQTNLATATGRSAYPQGQIINAHYSSNNVSPDVTLTWKPVADQTLYAAYKTGYKAGGISNPAILTGTYTATNLLFGPEHAKGFEVGYKADLLANTLRFDLTGYRYNYNGLQVTAYNSVTLTYSLRNAARARTTGVTGSLQWRATDRLTFSGNAGYNRARYLSFPNAQCHVGQTAADGCVGGVQDLSGKALNRAPEVTFRLGADYAADLGHDWTANFSMSGAYSSSYQTQADYTVGGFQPSYWMLNAAVHLLPPGEKYQLSLIGRNLTNTYYKIVTTNQSLGTPNQYTGSFSRPREVVLEAKYDF